MRLCKQLHHHWKDSLKAFLVYHVHNFHQSRTNAGDTTIPRERAPLAGTKAGQNLPRGNHTHAAFITQQNCCTHCVFAHSVGSTNIEHKQIRWFTFVFHLLISAVLHCSYVNDLFFSLSLSLFCCYHLSGNSVCRQLSWVWAISCQHVGDGWAQSLHTAE